MNLFISPCYGLNSITAIFYKDGFGNKSPMEFNMPLKKKKLNQIITVLEKEDFKNLASGDPYHDFNLK